MDELRRLPAIAVLGLLAMVCAAVFDLTVHLGAGQHAGHEGGGLAHLAHALGFAGMVLVLTGVVIDGARRQLRQRAARNGGLDGHAHR